MNNPPDDKKKKFDPSDTDLKLDELDRKILLEESERIKEKKALEERLRQIEEIEKTHKELKEKYNNGD